MSNVFCHIGLGDYVSASRAVAVIQVGSVTAKRRVSAAKKLGLYIDSSHGKGIKSYVLMDDNTVVASHMSTGTLAKRFSSDYDIGSDCDGRNNHLPPTVLHSPDEDDDDEFDETEEYEEMEEGDDEFEDEDDGDLD